MAEIYDFTTGEKLTEGLQGSNVCNEAIRAAKNIASDIGEPVRLVDDDERWDVYPDGRVEEGEAPPVEIDDGW